LRRIFVATVFAIAISCSKEPSGRLEVAQDTVRLYGRDYTWVPFRVGHAEADSVPRGVVLTPRDKSILRTSGNSMACLREGTTDVAAQLGSQTKEFVVICRFVTKLIGESYFELEPGAEPQRLSVTVSFALGDSDTLRVVSARSNDAAVATVRDGAVVPLAIGRAVLRVDYGGLWVRTTVYVRRTIFNGALTLRPDETRRWELDAGRYSITVKVNSRLDLKLLQMETDGLNCSRDSRDENTIHCMARERGEITFLQRPGSDPAGSASADVRILQIP
jgi:hypothetical protein